MRDLTKHYIDGAWTASDGNDSIAVINPATEAPCATMVLGTAHDLDRAAQAAHAAFPAFAATSKAQRIDLLTKILHAYMPRINDIAQVISEEMGCPISIAKAAQAMLGPMHLQATIEALKAFDFEEAVAQHHIVKEPIGVVGLITPWNWPINQIVAKVAPAIAAGCTMVLKPSEICPGNAVIFAEIMHEAGVPKGVFNLVLGDGPGVGEAMSKHPLIDMMSFTGSTRAGVQVAKNAADTVKRVHQELGGKSPNLILADADLSKAIPESVRGILLNTGQSCNAPTRLLVPADKHDEIVAACVAIASQAQSGDPMQEGMHLGPVANARQFERVQMLINVGINEGATLALGGAGRPENMSKGFFVKPTIFANVKNSMTIAQEEIFGPVVCIIPYKDEAEAIAIANDTPYGLAAYIWSTPEHAKQVARHIRAGNVHINGANIDANAPFGGFKQSGNGREFGKFGIEEFLETKAMLMPAA